MSGLLSNLMLQRLGLAVFHAFWELALVGLVAWVGLFCLRHRSAQSRYLWACLCFLAMAILPMATFGWLWGVHQTVQGALVDGGAILPSLTIRGGGVAFLNAVRTSAPWLALAWCAGAAAMLLRFGGGMLWLERTYLAQASPAPEALATTCGRLAQSLKLSRTVRILTSLRAETPLVIGWLRPIILVPSSALLHLSPEALEAVLAHELAHIHRGDYLINLLQTLAESFLFFHPAAWWLSRQIRELREHCCDDVAATLCGDPMILAEGLSALERLRQTPYPEPEPALAAAKGPLMHRIFRLMRPQDVPLPSLRGLALLLVGATFLGAATFAVQQESSKTAKAPRKAPSAASKPKIDKDGIANMEFAQVKILHRPETLAYPAEAKKQGIQGKVVVSLLIGKDGIPESAEAVEGPEALRSSAAEYAKEWRFKPVKVDGQAAKARFKLSIVFRLQ
ncbi:MAG: M56 family metallopeptidase [Holophagaceae bacterium]|nr:M56 family metallopeptidase [Holophagaceae bacterium]